MKTSEQIEKTCEAVEHVRLSRAATQHAIEQSRKSLIETQALLVALRLLYSGERLADASNGRRDLGPKVLSGFRNPTSRKVRC